MILILNEDIKFDRSWVLFPCQLIKHPCDNDPVEVCHIEDKREENGFILDVMNRLWRMIDTGDERPFKESFHNMKVLMTKVIY